MEPSWLTPLSFCTPIDPYFVFSVINSMTRGGGGGGGFHVVGPSFSFKKKMFIKIILVPIRRYSVLQHAIMPGHVISL